jgi:hypothetical protein
MSAQPGSQDLDTLVLVIMQCLNSESGRVLQSMFDKQIQDHQTKAAQHPAAMQAENDRLLEDLC